MNNIVEAGVRDLSLNEQKRRRRSEHRPDRIWSFYNSPLFSYDQTFADILGGRKMVDLVRGIKAPVVIDLMAPSGTLQDLFTKIQFNPKPVGLAVSLEDLRTELDTSFDHQLGITQIAGDITTSSTWKRIRKELDGRKADLIIERAIGGIDQLPPHAGFFAVSMQRMWQMLDKKGIILAQLREGFMSYQGRTVDLGSWVKYEKDQGINITLDRQQSTVLLQRTPDSPAILPMPDPQTCLLGPYVEGGEKKSRNTYPNFNIEYAGSNGKKIPGTDSKLDFKSKSK